MVKPTLPTPKELFTTFLKPYLNGFRAPYNLLYIYKIERVFKKDRESSNLTNREDIYPLSTFINVV